MEKLDQALQFLLKIPPFTGITAETLGDLHLRSIDFLFVLPSSAEDLQEFIEILIAKHLEKDKDKQSQARSEIQNISLLRNLAILHTEKLRHIAAMQIYYGVFPPEGDRLKRQAPISSAPTKITHRKFMCTDASTISAPQLDPNASTTPMRDQEEAARGAQVNRLLQIIERAGSATSIRESLVERYGEAAQDVLITVLGRGSPRTIMNHINRWERLENFVLAAIPHPQLSIYPPSDLAVARFLFKLDADKCGSSVPDSFLGTINWLCSRIGMECPDLQAPDLLAFRDAALRRRCDVLKQADPYPCTLIIALEVFVADGSNPAEAIVGFWELIRIYASIRWDDLQHVPPHELQEDDFAIYGVAWQTKVDRVRRGTRFAIPKVGITHLPWADKGRDLVKTYAWSIRDFMMCNLIVKAGEAIFDVNTPITWADYVILSRQVFAHALDYLLITFPKYFQATEEHDPKLEYDRLQEICQTLTPHGAKVTMIDLMAKAGTAAHTIQMQGHWASPQMPMHYTRSKDQIQIHELVRLTGDLANKWKGFPNDAGSSSPKSALHKIHPDHITKFTEEVDRLLVNADPLLARSLPALSAAHRQWIDGPEAPLMIQRWLTNHPEARADPATEDPLASSTTKDQTVEHVTNGFDPEDEETLISFYRVKDSRIEAKWHAPNLLKITHSACGRLQLADLIPMGTEPPDNREWICKKCLAARPDLECLF